MILTSKLTSPSIPMSSIRSRNKVEPWIHYWQTWKATRSNSKEQIHLSKIANFSSACLAKKKGLILRSIWKRKWKRSNICENKTKNWSGRRTRKLGIFKSIKLLRLSSISMESTLRLYIKNMKIYLHLASSCLTIAWRLKGWEI